MCKYKNLSLVLAVIVFLLASVTGLLPEFVIMIVIFAGALAASYSYFRKGDEDKKEKLGSFLQSVATILAIAAAVYLYHIERRSEPHADVSQITEAVALPNGEGVVIEAHVIVKNLGTQLLKLDHIHSRVQAIELGSIGGTKLLQLGGKEYQEASRMIAGRRTRLFRGTELSWPQVRVFEQDIKHEIEPGETDLITASFIFPCLTVRHVRVATDISKPKKSLFAELGIGRKRSHQEQHALVWKARSMVDLEPFCGKTQ